MNARAEVEKEILGWSVSHQGQLLESPNSVLKEVIGSFTNWDLKVS